ncbi:MAG: o-succinylbenzoate synthase [Flavobacteriales bacterium]|nr:o-succinylbenzoate synthase [Flavobacteriales bacterium]
MLKADFTSHTLIFNNPSGTSRGVLNTKPSWFLRVWNENNPNIYGIGECSPIKGLSIDPIDAIDKKLTQICNNINNIDSIDIDQFPCIKFGIETAFKDLKNGGRKIIFNNSFSRSQSKIKINGLIWMDNKEAMLNSIRIKIENGYNCLKLKIGAIDFSDELSLLAFIRKEFNSSELEIRVDANGAFIKENALLKLNSLAKFDIHSIEQPIKPKQFSTMNKLCNESPIPIALDEELIGIINNQSQENLLDTINPKYIVLKPSLLGGLDSTKSWIKLAEKRKIKWWVTSALESNIGLNSIAQFTAEFSNKLPQGLGTGQIYKNNIPSFLELKADELYINNELEWDLSNLKF